MKNIRCAFVTGGTGLLGINIVRELLENSSAQVVLLVRNATKAKRAALFNDLLSFNGGTWPVGFPYHRIEIVEGDITLPHLGIAPDKRKQLIKKIDMIYHSAAVITLSGAEEEVKAVNVKGTKNVLDFATLCKGGGPLERMIHVSTIGVAGDTEGIFYEDDLDVGQGFNNPYEKSKFEAERLVERYRKKGLNILIVRPSMVIGHSRTGVTNHFNIFYFQLRLLSQGILDIIPMHEEASYNLIPVDYAAKAIYLISTAEQAVEKNYHIVNSHDVSVGPFINKACSYLGYKKPSIVPIKKAHPLPATFFSGIRGKVLGIYYPYISSRKTYDASSTMSLLKPLGFGWPRIGNTLLTNILDYCVFSGQLPLKSEFTEEHTANF